MKTSILKQLIKEVINESDLVSAQTRTRANSSAQHYLRKNFAGKEDTIDSSDLIEAYRVGYLTGYTDATAYSNTL